VFEKPVWILFGRKTEEAKGDWRKLRNWKLNFSFPLNVITIRKGRRTKGTTCGMQGEMRNEKCIVFFGTLELFGRRTQMEVQSGS